MASAAGRDARQQHVITLLDRAPSRSDLGDRAHGLVTEDPSRRHRRDVAFEDVQVGATDGRRGDTNDRVAVVDDLGVRDLLPVLLSRSWKTTARIANLLLARLRLA
jgi:hypothetical protein